MLTRPRVAVVTSAVLVAEAAELAQSHGFGPLLALADLGEHVVADPAENS